MTERNNSTMQTLIDKLKEVAGSKLTQRQMDIATSPQLVIRKIVYSGKSWITDEVRREGIEGFVRLERIYPGTSYDLGYGIPDKSNLPDFEIFGEYNSQGYLVRETVVEMRNSVTKEFSPPGRFFGKKVRGQNDK